jgi:hypothetical protein
MDKIVKTENIITKEKWKIFLKSAIQYKKDQTGIGYYSLIPGNKTVFVYTLTEEPVDKTLRDAGYKEEILFELEGKIKEGEWKDEDLSKVNLLVGVHGFFKKSGVYPVKKGMLKLELPKKDLLNIYIKIEDPTYRVNKNEVKLSIPLL